VRIMVNLFFTNPAKYFKKSKK